MANNYSSIAKSTRIRIARNVKGMSFLPNKNAEACLKLVANVIDAVSVLGKYKVYHMGTLSKTDAEIMLGKHLVSKELVNNTESGSAVINEDETISIMVNEEDHIRAQCILKGLQLDRAYMKINEIDDEIGERLDYAFSEKYGYLTSCLTNVGTGLRASVMLFLPALTLASKIDKIISVVRNKGLVVRGELGEGSAALGYLYQVSNGVSLGISEREILSSVGNAVKEICELELEQRKKLLNEDREMVCDLAYRAWGILTNCYMLDFVEFMKIAGELKLGIALDLIRLKDNTFIDEIIDLCTDSAIKKASGTESLNENEICKARAKYVAKALSKLRVK